MSDSNGGSNIVVEKINETHLRVFAEPGIELELHEYFEFEVPGARYTPKFKAKIWDGKIRLYNLMTKTLYVGLLGSLITFANQNGYSITLGESIQKREKIDPQEIANFVDSLNLHAGGKKIEVRDYQYAAIHRALQNKRIFIKSPTASGKSAIIYGILRHHLEYNRKCIIIVPTTSLVEQLYKDFEDYSSVNGWSVAENCQKLYSGFTKVFTSKVLITTWQSIVKLNNAWFNQFDVLFGDEAHLFKAKSLVDIIEKMNKVAYRIGTSGTLDNKLVHKLVLAGLFGSIYDATTTKQLMMEKHIAKLKIKCLVLKYDDEIAEVMKKASYQKEIDYIVGNIRRSSFIANLAVSCTGNTLVLFNLIEKHGNIIRKMILEKAGDRKVFFITGNTPVEMREAARSLTANETNAIIVASYGVYSTGINIPSIENIIFASPTKSKIRNLQSIGRGLRLATGKEVCTLFDIADNLTWKSRVNFGMLHLEERCKIYAQEGFDFRIIEIPI